MTSQPDLATFWREEDPASLRCLVCDGPFTDSALIRTLKVRESDAIDDDDGDEQLPRCSRRIRTALGQTVLLFDRHWRCLRETDVHYAAVSHVWDRGISATQLRGYHTPQAADVTERALSAPVRICRGFRESATTPDDDGEFWHDYYSVPQWTDELKGPILLVIHEIFSCAQTVIVHLDDVGPDVVKKLLEGTTTEDRLAGLTGICNAKWYSRIWTAMELVRSNTVRTMISDGRFADPSCEPVFLPKLAQVWDDEVKKAHCVFCVEQAAGMGKNMVPWNLGPLYEVKRRKRTNFAMAYAMLSLRGGRDRMDFLHAFRGIVVGATTRRPLKKEFWDEFLETAKECLRVDDYSPLLITPVIHMEVHFNHIGYNDIFRWELGEETNPPLLEKALSIDEDTGRITAKLEAIGTVDEVVQVREGADGGWGSDDDVSLCATLTLKHTGPDVDRFVDGLGVRLFGEEEGFITRYLTEQGTLDTFRAVLQERYRCIGTDPWPIEGEHGVEWLLDTLSLSLPVQGRSEDRLGLIRARYGTMHCWPFNRNLSITCGTCRQTTLFRAGGYVPPEELVGARAFRVPRLKYQMSLANGMALLEKDGTIVGRMLWATPACPCHVMEDVIVRLPKYVAPQTHSD